VAARRLRSALATYRPVLDRQVTEDLREELRWFGQSLSRARDLQVMRGRMARLLDAQDPDLVLGPVRTRLDDELAASYAEARTAAIEVLDGDRYVALVDRLAALVQEPPLAPGADEAAATVLLRLLRRDLKRLHQRHRLVVTAETDDAREHALHDVRKAAKRLRYASEGSSAVLGPKAEQLAATAEAVQDLLGELQDTVVSRSTLRDVGIRAHLAGENGFTFGRLHALEEGTAARLVTAYPDTYAHLPKHKHLEDWLVVQPVDGGSDESRHVGSGTGLG
jgi:CHAD domain-containing protein